MCNHNILFNKFISLLIVLSLLSSNIVFSKQFSNKTVKACLSPSTRILKVANNAINKYSGSVWLTSTYNDGEEEIILEFNSDEQIQKLDGKTLLNLEKQENSYDKDATFLKIRNGNLDYKSSVFKDAFYEIQKENHLVYSFFKKKWNLKLCYNIKKGRDSKTGKLGALVLSALDKTENTLKLEETLLDETGEHYLGSKIFTKAQIYHDILEDFIIKTHNDDSENFIDQMTIDAFKLIKELEYIHSTGHLNEVVNFIKSFDNRISEPAAKLILDYAKIKATTKNDIYFSVAEFGLIRDYIFKISKIYDFEIPSEHQLRRDITRLLMELGDWYTNQAIEQKETNNSHKSRQIFNLALRQYSHALSYRPQDATLRTRITEILNHIPDLLTHEEVNDFLRIWTNPNSTISELWEFIKEKFPFSELKFIPESEQILKDGVQVKSFYDQIEQMTLFLDHLDGLFGDTPQVTRNQFYEFLNAKLMKGDTEKRKIKLKTALIDDFIDKYDRITRYNPTSGKDTNKKILWLSSIFLFYTRILHGDGSMDAWLCLPKTLKKFSLNNEEIHEVIKLITLWRNFGTLFFGEGSPLYQGYTEITQEKLFDKLLNDDEKKVLGEANDITVNNGSNDELLDEFLTILDSDKDVYKKMQDFKDDKKLTKLFPILGDLEKCGKYGTNVLDHSLQHLFFIDTIIEGENLNKLNKQKVGRLLSQNDFDIFHKAILSIINQDSEKYKRLVYMISLFHDCGESNAFKTNDIDFDPSAPHEIKGIYFLKEIIKKIGPAKIGFSDEDVDKICWIINSHVDLGTIHFGERTIAKLEDNIGYPSNKKEQKEWIKLLALINTADVYAIYGGEPLSNKKAEFFASILRDENYLDKEFNENLCELRLKIFCSNNKGNLFSGKYEKVKQILKEWEVKNPVIYNSFMRNLQDIYTIKVFNYAIFFFQSLNADSMIRILMIISIIIDKTKAEFGDQAKIEWVEFTAKSFEATFSADPINEVLKNFTIPKIVKNIAKSKSLKDIKKFLHQNGIRIDVVDGKTPKSKKLIFDNKRLLEDSRYIKLSSILSLGVIFSKARNVVTESHMKSLTFLHALTNRSKFLKELKKNWVKIRIFYGFCGEGRDAIDIEKVCKEFNINKSLADEAEIFNSGEMNDIALELNQIKELGKKTKKDLSEYDDFVNFLSVVNIKNGVWNLRKLLNKKNNNRKIIIRLFYLLYRLKIAYESNNDEANISVIKFSHELNPSNIEDVQLIQNLVRNLQNLTISEIDDIFKLNDSPFRALSHKIGLIGNGIMPEINNVMAFDTLLINLKSPQEDFPDSKYVLFLDEESCKDSKKTGGKGANLAEIKQNIPKVLVPEGFVATTDIYEELVSDEKIQKLIDELQQLSNKWVDFKINGATETQINKLNILLQNKSDQIRQQIMKQAFSEEAKKSIRSAYSELEEEFQHVDLPVAVRSSSIFEDTLNASSAGQQNTDTNVMGEVNVLESTKKTFASLFNYEAVNYRNKQRFEQYNQSGKIDKTYMNHKDAKIAVVIQRMINGMASATGFSCDKETGRDGLYIEAIYGLGAFLVDGEITPDRWFFNPDNSSLYYKQKNKKEKELIGLNTGGTKQVDVDQKRQNRYVFNDMEKPRYIAEIIKQVRDYYRKDHKWKHVDTEFAIDKDGTVYLVQARPETAFSFDTKKPVEVVPNIKENKEKLIYNGGTRVWPGSFTGRAVIAQLSENPSDAEILEIQRKVKPNDILFINKTVPQIQSLMLECKAIFTEQGGASCHAALVGQEYKLPTVVGAKNLIVTLQNNNVDGTIVTVDTLFKKVYFGEIEPEQIELTDEVLYKEVSDQRIKERIDDIKHAVKKGSNQKYVYRTGEKNPVSKLQADLYEKAFSEKFSSLLGIQINCEIKPFNEDNENNFLPITLNKENQDVFNAIMLKGVSGMIKLLNTRKIAVNRFLKFTNSNKSYSANNINSFIDSYTEMISHFHMRWVYKHVAEIKYLEELKKLPFKDRIYFEDVRVSLMSSFITEQKKEKQELNSIIPKIKALFSKKELKNLHFDTFVEKIKNKKNKLLIKEITDFNEKYPATDDVDFREGPIPLESILDKIFKIVKNPTKNIEYDSMKESEYIQRYPDAVLAMNLLVNCLVQGENEHMVQIREQYKLRNWLLNFGKKLEQEDFISDVENVFELDSKTVLDASTNLLTKEKGKKIKFSKIVMVGKPFSDAAVYGKELAKILNIDYLSIGDELKKITSNNQYAKDKYGFDSSTVFNKISNVIKKGELIEDEIADTIIKKLLTKEQTENGFVLDGYPRNSASDDFLTSVLKEYNHEIDVYLMMDVNEEYAKQKAKREALYDGDVYFTRVANFEAHTARLLRKKDAEGKFTSTALEHTKSLDLKFLVEDILEHQRQREHKYSKDNDQRESFKTANQVQKAA